MPGVAAVDGVAAAGVDAAGAASAAFDTALLAAGAATFLAAGFAAGFAAAFAGAAFFAAGFAAGFAAAFAGAAFFAAGFAAGFAAAFAGAAFFAAGFAAGFAAAFAGAAFFAAGFAAGFAAAFTGAAFFAAGLAAGLLGALAFFAPFFASASAMTYLLWVTGLDSTSAPPVAEGPFVTARDSAPRHEYSSTNAGKSIGVCLRVDGPQHVRTINTARTSGSRSQSARSCLRHSGKLMKARPPDNVISFALNRGDRFIRAAVATAAHAFRPRVHARVVRRNRLAGMTHQRQATEPGNGWINRVGHTAARTRGKWFFRRKVPRSAECIGN